MTFSDAERDFLTDPKSLIPHEDEPEIEDEREEQVRRCSESTRCALLANPHAGVRSEQ